MTLRPGTLVRTPRVRQVRLFSAQLHLTRTRVLLEQLGVVVHRRSEFFIAIVELGLRAGRRIEIDSPLVLLHVRAGDSKWRVISIVDDCSQASLAGSMNIKRRLLDVNLPPVALHVDAADLAGPQPQSLVGLHFHLAPAITLSWVNLNNYTLHSHIPRNV